MPAEAPRSPGAQAVLDAVSPQLVALGVAHVEVVVRGTRSMRKFWVGYRLGPGVTRSHEVRVQGKPREDVVSVDMSLDVREDTLF